MDQRKVNMLAREYCTEAKIKHKPVILSHRAFCFARPAAHDFFPPVPEETLFCRKARRPRKRRLRKQTSYSF